MFACLTCADSWNESDSPCEPYSAPKPTNDDWSIPHGLPSTPPGLPCTPQSSWQPYSDSNATQNSWVFSADMCSAVPAFRKANERRNPSPEQKYSFDTSVPNRLLEQTRISIPNWNRCPDVADRVPLRSTLQVSGTLLHYKKRSSISSTSASWTISTLPTSPGAPSFLTKTLFTRTSGVNSVWIHDTRTGQQQEVEEGQSGCVLQAVISRASFWRIPRNGKFYFTMNHYDKKGGIAKKCYLQSVL